MKDLHRVKIFSTSISIYLKIVFTMLHKVPQKMTLLMAIFTLAAVLPFVQVSEINTE